MAAKKRRGKTFITEHYADAQTVNALNKAFMEIAPQLDKFAINSLKSKKEISVWADPRGMFFYFGHGQLPRLPQAWSIFTTLTDQDISTILFGMKKAFELYGTLAGSGQFKIILNEDAVEDIATMLEL